MTSKSFLTIPLNKHYKMPRLDLVRQFLILIIIAIAELLMRDEPVTQHNSILTGQRFYDELIDTNNENRFRNSCRMDKETFLKLLMLLTRHGGLHDGHKVGAGEKLMIFLHLLTGFSNRQTAERWQHSGSTINACMTSWVPSIDVVPIY